MSRVKLEQRSALQKITVQCKNCGVSESFYSKLSVDKFKVRHRGHEVVGGGDRTVQARTGPEAAPAPVGSDKGIVVAKILVDVLNFPSLGSPMVRVRGFDAGLDEAFTATLLLKEAPKIKGMLDAGRYLDQDASGLLYVWEQGVVEFVDDAKAKLDSAGQARESELVEEATVASAAEVVIETVSDETIRAESVGVQEQYFLLPPTQGAPGAPDQSAVTPPAQPIQTRPIEAAVTAPAPVNQQAPRTDENTKSEEVASPSEDAKEEGYLLVSKSWYIQGGTGNRKEAERISKVLKEFRWKIEPVYTIGVILDDMLSIETSRSQISGTVIKRIEGAGYRLTAVASDQGKPVAWFKREDVQAAAGRRTGGLSPSDSEMELEADATG